MNKKLRDFVPDKLDSIIHARDKDRVLAMDRAQAAGQPYDEARDDGGIHVGENVYVSQPRHESKAGNPIIPMLAGAGLLAAGAAGLNYLMTEDELPPEPIPIVEVEPVPDADTHFQLRIVADDDDNNLGIRRKPRAARPNLRPDPEPTTQPVPGARLPEPRRR